LIWGQEGQHGRMRTGRREGDEGVGELVDAVGRETFTTKIIKAA
jgi:hypothetical protein